jgi:hypothetical protein
MTALSSSLPGTTNGAVAATLLIAFSTPVYAQLRHVELRRS